MTEFWIYYNVKIQIECIVDVKIKKSLFKLFDDLFALKQKVILRRETVDLFSVAMKDDDRQTDIWTKISI